MPSDSLVTDNAIISQSDSFGLFEYKKKLSDLFKQSLKTDLAMLKNLSKFVFKYAYLK
jgi:hypothetical protein